MKKHSKLKSLIEIFDQPVMVRDTHGRILAVNHSFKQIYGISDTRAQMRQCDCLLCADERSCRVGPDGRDCPFSTLLEPGKDRTREHLYVDARRRERRVVVQAFPLRMSDGEVYRAELVQDDSICTHPSYESDSNDLFVGDSPPFRGLLQELAQAARTSAPVLLQGETGTGKELAAQYIHRLSPRREGPFMTLDCTALTPDLFESEVFGHERGAFTGSVSAKPGIFELADGGTLFLDEIGDMPLPLQAKLLRVLESGTYRRVGGVVNGHANVRLVSATNRPLREGDAVRRDLYYRIACVALTLPPLRERKADIEVLSRELLKRIGSSACQSYTLERSAVSRLCEYDFPGNVRELRNILWRVSFQCVDGRIRGQDIASVLSTEPQGSFVSDTEPVLRHGIAPTAPGNPPANSLRQLETKHLRALLDHHGGNRRIVAMHLGVSERTVYRKLKRLGLS